MNKKRLRLLYIIFDLLTSQIAWTLFFFFRKIVFEQKLFGGDLRIIPDNRLLTGLIVIPVFWLILNFIAGFYDNPFRKSRLRDFGLTFFITLTGSIILFFALILDDFIRDYSNYYLSFGVLFGLQFTLSSIPRHILTSITVKRIHRGKIGFNTLLIGSNGKASDIYEKIITQPLSSGNKFIGFITVSEEGADRMGSILSNLGSLENLNRIIESHEVEEVIIAIEPTETETIGKIIYNLNNTGVIIKVIPGVYDILMGRIKMSAIFGTPLIILNADSIPLWQYNIKRITDYINAFLSLIILSPVSLVLTVAIKLSGKGPVIFRQERIGLKGKPFNIYKFRSMVYNAEANGPQLSSDSDQRVTNIGRFIRKHRLDEIPNFINVLKGEMSIVGPRPERQVYIDQIVKVAPSYRNLLRIKPGITSWGQIKFGYASNIEEMVKRLDYDLIYLENRSLYIDFKIIIYTLLTILRGHGI